MKIFCNGFKFLGYQMWLDEENMLVGSLEGGLKVVVEKCDCFVVWLSQEYFESNYCKVEFLYVQKNEKIIFLFGVYCEIKEYLMGEFEFLIYFNIYDIIILFFFEVFWCIDEFLFNFELLIRQLRFDMILSELLICLRQSGVYFEYEEVVVMQKV